jgi:hypothetical protein
MEMVLIKENSQEWEYMHKWLANHPINQLETEPTIAINPLNDEKWAYIASYREDMKIIHEFRHKSHPKDNERYFLSVAASDNISGEDIEKVFNI